MAVAVKYVYTPKTGCLMEKANSKERRGFRTYNQPPPRGYTGNVLPRRSVSVSPVFSKIGGIWL